MITDKLLRVSAAQVVTASAVSTDVIDLSQARDIGEGEALYMHFSVDTVVASGTGGSTVEFQVIGSATNNLAAPVVLGSSGAIVKTALVAGARVAVRINPIIGSRGYRYIGANYVVSAALTTGAFTADIVVNIADNKTYPSGFVVA